MDEDPQNAMAPENDKKASLTPFLLAITFVLVVTVSLPTVILLFFAMMPTIVAYIVDRTSHKYSVYCVGGLNFCGVYPFLTDLWTGQHTISATLDILTDIFTLLVIYSAAGFGWVLFIVLPPLVSTVLNVMTQRRVGQLRRSQKTLTEEWGDNVGGDAKEISTDTKQSQEEEIPV